MWSSTEVTCSISTVVKHRNKLSEFKTSTLSEQNKVVKSIVVNQALPCLDCHLKLCFQNYAASINKHVPQKG